MKKKWQYVLNKKQLIFLIIIFFAIIFLSFLEVIGLASLTTFVSIIVNNDLNYFHFLPFNPIALISDFSLEKKMFYGSIFLFFLFLFKSIYQILFNYLEVTTTRDITVTNSERFFKSTIFSPYYLHLNRNSSYLIRKIQIDIYAVTYYFYNLLTIIKEMIILISIFLLLFLTDPKISSATFLMLGVFSLLFYFSIKNKLTRLTKETQKNKANLIQNVTHSVSSFKENLILRIRKHIVEKYCKELKSIEHFNFYTSFIMKMPRIFLELLAVTGLLVVTFLFIFFGKPLNEMIPLLTLLVASLVRMIPSFNSLTAAFATLRINQIKYDEISEDLKNQEKYIKYFNKEEKTKKFENKFQNEINLDDISFKFEGTDRRVLNNISLKIKKGQSVGIIGKTGSGKTTLVDIILGVLQPTSGKISVDGEQFNEENISNWHAQIGYIPQDIYLINDSIKKNIAIGIEESKVDEDILNQAIKIARLDKFILNLPEGINTKVGERGIKVSGGEKQRISIARAFYNKPSVIVMDEATSSLDNLTEKEFMESIERVKYNATLIIIAHRLSTIKQCDFVYLLSEGTIKDKGKFEELIIRNKELNEKIELK